MHPSTEHIMQFFKSEHLPGHLRQVSTECEQLANRMLQMLPENPELTAGLRKLLEAKDCFVRARVVQDKEAR